MGTETMISLMNFLNLFLKNIKKDQKQRWKEVIFVFESVDLLYYSLHKISLNRGGPYIDSPELLKNKGATINPRNEDNGCSKYAIAVALNHEKIEKKPTKNFKN